MIANLRQHGLREEGADVDREIKPAEGGAKELFLAGALLVVGLAEEGRDVGLSYSAAEGQEAQCDDECGAVLDPQDEMTQHIRDGETDDCPVFANESIGEKAAEERQEVDRHF